MLYLSYLVKSRVGAVLSPNRDVQTDSGTRVYLGDSCLERLTPKVSPEGFVLNRKWFWGQCLHSKYLPGCMSDGVYSLKIKAASKFPCVSLFFWD